MTKEKEKFLTPRRSSSTVRFNPNEVSVIMSQALSTYTSSIDALDKSLIDLDNATQVADEIDRKIEIANAYMRTRSLADIPENVQEVMRRYTSSGHCSNVARLKILDEWVALIESGSDK